MLALMPEICQKAGVLRKVPVWRCDAYAGDSWHAVGGYEPCSKEGTVQIGCKGRPPFNFRGNVNEVKRGQ